MADTFTEVVFNLMGPIRLL